MPSGKWGNMDSRTRKIAGWVVAAVGAAMAIVGGLADQIGLGGEGEDEFGARQVMLLVAGLIVLGIGLVVALVLKDGKSAEPAS